MNLILGAQGGIKAVPFVPSAPLSLSHTWRGSRSIRSWEAEADSTVICNILKFQAESSFGACIRAGR